MSRVAGDGARRKLADTVWFVCVWHVVALFSRAPRSCNKSQDPAPWTGTEGVKYYESDRVIENENETPTPRVGPLRSWAKRYSML